MMLTNSKLGSLGYAPMPHALHHALYVPLCTVLPKSVHAVIMLERKSVNA